MRSPLPSRGLAVPAILLSTLLAVPAAAQSIDAKEIVLENGLRVLLVEREGDPNVAAGWVAKVGSVNERPGITGLSHLFEHVMFKGTHAIGTKDIEADLALNEDQDRVRAVLRAEQEDLDRRFRLGEIPDPKDPAARSERHVRALEEFDALLRRQKELLIDNELDQIYTREGGAGLNAGTTHDFTIYFISLPANKLELWFWLESDRLANPVFRQFYSERDVVWEERRLRVDSTPTGRLDEQYDAMFWMASPYSWPVIGWPSDLDGITREEAEAYFDRNYAPGNLTAALVGDFDLAEAEALARRYFGRLEPSAEPPTPVRTFEPAQEAAKRLIGEADTRPTVKVRWHGVPHGHVDEPVADVVADLLNGQTGRLRKSLVQEQKVATQAQASHEARRHGGYFQLTGVAAEGRTPEEVETALLAEIRRLQEQPVDERELQKVKNQALADKLRGLQGNFFVLFQLLAYDAVGHWSEINTYSDRILAVTPADVQRVARTWFPENGQNVAIYRTRASQAAADPDLAALDEQQRTLAMQIKSQVDSVGDPAGLEQVLAQVQAGKAQGGPEVAPVMTWAEGYVKSRIASLKGAAR